jgi:hypothetical protein
MKPYRVYNGESKCEDRAPRWRAVIASSLLVATWLLHSSAVDARSGDVIWEGDDQSVVLAPQDDANAPSNEHPVSLEPQDIEAMLSALRFRQADQEADAPPAAVFNKEQVQVLSDAFANGLSRATKSQDVTFSVVGPHRLAPGALALRNRLTAGRAFFRDGKLNVIFGEIQSPYRKKNIYGRLEEDFYPRKFGSRIAPEAQESELVAGTGSSLRSEAGGRRGDWIMFAASGASASAQPTQPVPIAGPQDAAQTPGERPVPPDTGAPEQTPALPAHTDEPGAIEQGPDIEQRLETLKRLREKNLISEEIYREKVDEILEDL